MGNEMVGGRFEERKAMDQVYQVVSEDIRYAQILSQSGYMIQTLNQLEDGKICLVFGTCNWKKGDKIGFTKTQSFTTLVEIYPDHSINSLLGAREPLVPGYNPEIEPMLKYKEKWIGNKRYAFLIARRLDLFNCFSNIVVYAKIEKDISWTRFHSPIGDITEIFDIGYTNQMVILTCTDNKTRRLICAISPDGRPALQFNNPSNLKNFTIMEKFLDMTFALVGRSDTALHFCPFTNNAFSNFEIAMPREVVAWEIIHPNILLTISQTGEWYYYQLQAKENSLSPNCLGVNKLTGIPASIKEPFHNIKVDILYCPELQFPIVGVVSITGFLTMFLEAKAPFVNNARVSSQIQKGVSVTFLKLQIVMGNPSPNANGLFIHIGTSSNLLIVLKIDLSRLFS